MDGQNAIEEASREIQCLLAVPDMRAESRKAFSNLFRHVLPKLKRHVITFLLRGEMFVLEVLPQPSADFKGGDEILRCPRYGIAMVEIVHHAVFPGQHFMQVLHEIIADPLLLGRKRRDCFRPQRCGFHASLPREQYEAAETSAV